MGARAIVILLGLSLPVAAVAGAPILNRPLHAVHEDPAPLLYQSVGRRKLIEHFKLADPAPAITSALGRETCALVACTNLIPDVEDNALTLSVRTTHWTLTHLETAWDRYRITYKVDARLLDNTRDKVLASAEYVYSEKYDDPDKAPLLEDMLRDDGSLLKSKFREVEPLAVAELKEEIEEDLRHNGLLGRS